MALEASRKNIVIVGGGIIGCTTAYFLTRHPLYSPATHKITILEATSIAAGASGKAGGLLALWAYPACIVPLSYRLHEELAKEHDGAKRWGYRQIYCGSVDCTGKVRERKGGKGVVADGEGREWNKLPKTKGGSIKKGRGDVPSDLDWLDGDTVKEYSVMGTPDTTAQVHPLLFTTSMADLAVSSGASIVLGKVTSINASSSSVQSVTYTEKATQEVKTLEATDVIISAGPWTSKVFPAAPIEAMRAHSVVIKAEVAPYAIFSEIALPKGFNRTGGQGVETRRHGLSVSPEMYARPDGTVYACEGDSIVPLPETADQVVVDEERCRDIIDYVGTISTPLHEGEIIARQACYLPSVSTGGGPLIGETGIKGLLMATGHTCWGIQNSCATGKVMSEFVFEGRAKSANVGSLDPRNVL